MKYQLNKLTVNNTSRFLRPCLREYGKEFTTLLSKVFKLGYGIADMYNNEQYEKHIFILCNAEKTPVYFQKLIQFLREQDYYEDDYPVGHLLDSNLHMLVISIPEEWFEKFELFRTGKYSKMFSQKEIDKLLDDEAKSIVIKDHNYRVQFVGKLNKLFKTNLTEKDIEHYEELELPPDVFDFEKF